MTTSIDDVDLAKNLYALANVLTDVLVPKMRDYAAGLITEWSTPEKAEDLAAVLEETARHVRHTHSQANSQEETCATPDLPASRWKPAAPATGLDLRRDSRTVLPVEASDKSLSASSSCDRCDGDGVMRWQQPGPDGKGGTILREMEHPCPRPGCGPGWKHPAAEQDRTVNAPTDSPARAKGHAAAANQLPDVLGEELLRIYAKYSRE